MVILNNKIIEQDCECIPIGMKIPKDFSLGGIFKGIGRGIGRVASTVGRIVKPVVNVAGKVLSNPIVGTVGSFIPYVGPAIKVASTALAVANGIRNLRSNPLGAIASIGGAVGGLGGIGGTIGRVANIAGKVGRYAQTAQTIIGASRNFRQNPLGTITTVGGAIGGLGGKGTLGQITNFAQKAGHYARDAQTVIGAARNFRENPLSSIQTIGHTFGGLPVRGRLQQFTHAATGRVGQFAGAAQRFIGTARNFQREHHGAISTVGRTIGAIPMGERFGRISYIARRLGL